MEAVLTKIITSLSNSYGEALFDKLVVVLNDVTNADYTYIALFDHKMLKAKTISFAYKSDIVDNFEYDLLSTPCHNVSKDSVCIYPENVCSLFPNDALLSEMTLEGYIGIPLYNVKGDVIGSISSLFKQPILASQQTLVITLFRIFSGRISGEVERINHEKEIAFINQNLERLVNERSRELEVSIQELDLAESKLVESEKMAALGDLMSSIAHDVNTPLGVSITAETHLKEVIKQFKEKFIANTLTRTDLSVLVEQSEQAILIIHRNLERAKVLVDNFKKTAADQHNIEQELLIVKDYYQQVFYTLSPLLKRKNVVLEFSCADGLKAKTYAGAHAQVLTNLINNSIMHGFSNDSDNRISICVNQKTDDVIEVDYQDNGAGIPKKIGDKIYEPFYTTARKIGGTGLGMSIIFNILSKKLNGQIQCIPSNKGAHFIYSFSSE